MRHCARSSPDRTKNPRTRLRRKWSTTSLDSKRWSRPLRDEIAKPRGELRGHDVGRRRRPRSPRGCTTILAGSGSSAQVALAALAGSGSSAQVALAAVQLAGVETEAPSAGVERSSLLGDAMGFEPSRISNGNWHDTGFEPSIVSGEPPGRRTLYASRGDTWFKPTVAPGEP